VTEETESSTEIKETDIVFDCPFCGKSLAIDYRGAGLTIPCTDCGNDVEVPIPEGMELTDIDSTAEDQEVRILHLRRSLGEAQRRIRSLEAELEELRGRSEELEKHRTDSVYRCGAVLRETSVLQNALNDLGERVKRIADEAGHVTS
jgi:transcription elongation factor Elf1